VRKLDVTNKDSIFALAEELGRIDILFNCAGSVYFVLQCYLELVGLPGFAWDLYSQLCLSVFLFFCLFLSEELGCVDIQFNCAGSVHLSMLLNDIR
jgi:hypothetical protein